VVIRHDNAGIRRKRKLRSRAGDQSIFRYDLCPSRACGWRSRDSGLQQYVLVLFDTAKFSAEDLATVCRWCWHAELNLRLLQSVMQMDHLRYKTREMSRNQSATHLVAYNLILRLMAEVAPHQDLLVRSVNFRHALQTCQGLHDRGMFSASHTSERLAFLSEPIAWHRAGNRPNRLETRTPQISIAPSPRSHRTPLSSLEPGYSNAIKAIQLSFVPRTRFRLGLPNCGAPNDAKSIDTKIEVAGSPWRRPIVRAER